MLKFEIIQKNDKNSRMGLKHMEVNMETFADYILSEKDFIKKLQIMYYLQKRIDIFFDNSVILKAEVFYMPVRRANLH